MQTKSFLHKLILLNALLLYSIPYSCSFIVISLRRKKELLKIMLLPIMVLLLDNLCYMICIRHLITSRAVTDRKRHIFLHACATCSELPSNIITILPIYNNLFLFYGVWRVFCNKIGSKVYLIQGN